MCDNTNYRNQIYYRRNYINLIDIQDTDVDSKKVEDSICIP